jgi:hypothetical protein
LAHPWGDVLGVTEGQCGARQQRRREGGAGSALPRAPGLGPPRRGAARHGPGGRRARGCGRTPPPARPASRRAPAVGKAGGPPLPRVPRTPPGLAGHARQSATARHHKAPGRLVQQGWLRGSRPDVHVHGLQISTAMSACRWGPPAARAPRAARAARAAAFMGHSGAGRGPQEGPGSEVIGSARPRRITGARDAARSPLRPGPLGGARVRRGVPAGGPARASRRGLRAGRPAASQSFTSVASRRGEGAQQRDRPARPPLCAPRRATAAARPPPATRSHH